jgi:hypothetical protein
MEVSMRDIPGTESAALLSFALVSELIEVLKAKNVHV